MTTRQTLHSRRQPSHWLIGRERKEPSEGIDAELDALYERMQTPAAHAALDRVFGTHPRDFDAVTGEVGQSVPPDRNSV